MNLVDVLQGAQVALAVLQARLILLITLLLTAGLFGAAMWIQTPLAASICVAWGLIIFLPVLLAGRGSHDVPEAPQHTETAPHRE